MIHAKVIDATGGRHGVRDVGLLISICERPKTALFGKDMFVDIFAKAAVYLESFATYHVFVDGNKRTAITSAARFLYLNGYELKATQQILERFVLQVATRKHSLEVIASWLEQNSRVIA